MPFHKTVTAQFCALVLLLLVLTPVISKAQQNSYFLDVSGGSGRLVPHHPLLNPLAGPVSFLNARLVIKTLGQKEWQRIFNYPQIGIGLSHNYLTKSYLGNPTAAYSFVYLPFFQVAKLRVNLGIHLGLAWGIKPFSEQNPDNVALGSKCAAYASLNLNSSVILLPNLELIFSSGGYHYSNGNFTKPNKGLNMLGAEAGLRYRLTKSDAEKNTSAVTPAEKTSSIRIFGAYGWKKEITLGPTYTTGSISIGYYRTINNKSTLSAGSDLFYDEGVLNYTQKENLLKNVLAGGIFAGHELTVGQLSIVTQAGIYLFNPHPADPFYYERLGLRYLVAKRFIPSLTLKAHEFKIDFVEWGIGFMLWKSK